MNEQENREKKIEEWKECVFSKKSETFKFHYI